MTECRERGNMQLQKLATFVAARDWFVL